MGLNRRVKLDKRQADALETKRVNKVRKDRERDRRDTRMLETIRAGSLPFTPDVMSWLSRKTGKPSSRITPEDIAKLIA
jgi:hypothetical protein